MASPMRHFTFRCSRRSAGVSALLGFLFCVAGCSQGGAGPGAHPTADLGLGDEDGGTDRPDLKSSVDMTVPVSEGKPEWGHFYKNQGQEVGGVATGPDGTVYLTGSFGVANFGDGEVTSQGESDCFLLKLDKAGKRIWTRTFGRPFIDVPTDVTVDRAGNAVITGYSTGSVGGRGDAFIAYFASDGTQRYFKPFGTPSAGRTVTPAVAAAFGADGSVYATGYFEDRINFGGADLVSQGSRDIFLLHLDAAGTHLFSKSWGRSAVDSPGALAVLPDGDLVMAGLTSGPVNFGDGEKGSVVEADFMARFSPQGVARWSTRWSLDANARLVAVAPDSSLWFATDLNMKPISLGGRLLTSPTGYGLATAHYSGTGAYLDSFLIPSSAGSYYNAIAVDSAGQPVLGGVANGNIDFGFGPTGQSNGTAFFLKQSVTGRVLWAWRFGGPRIDAVQGIAVGADNHVVAAGTLDEPARLGAISLSPDTFVLSLTP